MKRTLRNSWKPIAMVFVVVGLVGGPAYAAGLAANSVRSGHIKDGHVRVQDIATDAVGADEIAAGAVGSSEIGSFAVSNDKLGFGSVTGGFLGKIASNTVTGANIADGTVTNTELGAITTRTESVVISAGSAGLVSALCDDGEIALSAGALWDGAPTVGPVYIAQLALSNTNVTVAGRNDGAGSRTLTAQVRCLA